jgi:electron transfer flavoprotein beta subunit
MKIVVCVKQIRHTYTRTGIDVGTHFLAPEDSVFRVNPYDEAAMAQALHLKGQLGEVEISILTMGHLMAEKELRRTAAMGADHLYHVEQNGDMDPWTKSGILVRAVQDLETDLILCGKESLDKQNGQVPSFMAHRLGMPFVSAITDITPAHDMTSVTVRRSGGRGTRQVIRCPLPAVLSVDIGSEEPPSPSYRDQKRAKDLPIRKLTYAEPIETHKASTLRIFPPRPRPKKVSAPDSSLPAHKRIEHLLSGSRVEKGGTVLTGSPESQVEGIVSYLLEHGLLQPCKGPEEE